MTLRYGSTFAGYGGLELGVQTVLGGTTAWHAENDAAPAAVLAHHWPAAPNHGDITAIDWAAVEPVDILTGGFPCQDVSHAGKRLGLKPGTRSGLWSHLAYAIDQVRPALLVAENVRGLLNARAASDVEPCPWCLGNPTTSPLRALGAVLGDLADIGYDADWYGVPASAAGCCHNRFRVFVFAWPADTPSSRRHEGRSQPDGVHRTAGQGRDSVPVRADGRGATADADQSRREGSEPTGGRLVPTWSAPADPENERCERDRQPRNGRPGPTDSHDPSADTGSQRHGRLIHPGPMGRLDDEDADDAPQRQRSWEVAEHRGSATSHDPQWGIYGPAIRRWEHHTRPAPSPTEPGRNGPRLSPAFVEWMMGLPAGHVTDPAIGLTRAAQLKILGNGVVPQQAALATQTWLANHPIHNCARHLSTPVHNHPSGGRP